MRKRMRKKEKEERSEKEGWRDEKAFLSKVKTNTKRRKKKRGRESELEERRVKFEQLNKKVAGPTVTHGYECVHKVALPCR